MENKNLISIVIPIYNEEENLEELFNKLKESLLKNKIENFEIILIDDGSKDNSWEIIKKFKEKDERVRGIRFSRNFGQTLAIYAGFQEAKGNTIITMDADLQNDPEDIKKLIEEMERGYDVVSGWRKERKDPFFTKVLPSRIANFMISFITGVKLKDYGCTLKAYKSEIVKNLRLYGEMHRFLPALCAFEGAKIKEIPVKHNKRLKGKSKYGLKRVFKVLLDLLTVKFMGSYLLKPIYFFGSIGIIFLFLSFIFTVWTIYDKLFLKVWVHRNPKILIAFMFFPVGIQFILMGLLMEILIRNYFESQGKTPYIIKEKI
ncbi:MAG: glycosyltransferase family 2 protein [candidate division WOR-3 bacterium]